MYSEFVRERISRLLIRTFVAPYILYNVREGYGREGIS